MDSGDVLGQAAREALDLTSRRCTATNRAGDRCGKPPIVGGFVCEMHGGKVPAVQKSARERLLALVDPAMDFLMRCLRHAPPCPHCGRSDADRDPVVLRAAQLVLDRAGFHPTLAVQPTATSSFAGLSLAQIADQAELYARKAREMADREATRAIDAVLVEPGEGQG